jgi:hypothetical protein
LRAVRRWTREQALAWLASQFEGGEESSECRSVAEFFNERPSRNGANLADIKYIGRPGKRT